MKKYLLKKLVLSAYFIVMSFLIVMVTFPVMKMGVIPKYFWMDVCFVFAIASITFLCPLLVQEILHIVILLVEFIIMIVSSSLYLSRGDVFSWELIQQAGQVKDVSEMIKLPAWSIVAGVLFLAGYVVLWVILKAPKIQLKKFYSLVLIGITVGCVAFAVCGDAFVRGKIIGKTSNTDEHYYVSDSYHFSTYQSAYSSLQKFGFYGFYVEDLLRKIFPSLKPDSEEINKANMEGYHYEKYTSILNGLCEDNNVIMICAESFEICGISKELTPVLWSLKYGVDLSQSGIGNYYNVTKNNGKTSLTRRDFNTAESGYEYNGTDIYSGVSAGRVGLQFSKHRSHDHTQTSEMNMLSSSSWDYNYTIAKSLDNYKFTYIHGNVGNFYTRSSRMQGVIGFDQALFIEDMQDFAIGEFSGLNCYSIDSETIRHYTDDDSESVFPINEKFLTFFMTITTHSPYAYSSFLDDNYAMVDAVSSAFCSTELFSLYNNTINNTLRTNIREYYARILDTEYSLAYLVNYLYENNILDKTIIAFSGDHPAYLTDINRFNTLFIENVLHDNATSYLDVVEGFVYSTRVTRDYLTKNNESRVISFTTQMFDYIPTILTMLGREYDQDDFMGYPVINKSIENPTKTLYNKVMHSYNYGYFVNENFKSVDGTTVTILNPNVSYSEQEIKQFIKECNDIVLKNNYVLENRRK